MSGKRRDLSRPFFCNCFFMSVIFLLTHRQEIEKIIVNKKFHFMTVTRRGNILQFKREHERWWNMFWFKGHIQIIRGDAIVSKCKVVWQRPKGGVSGRSSHLFGDVS